MIAAVALAVSLAQTPAAPPSPAMPPAVADWPTLPLYPLPRAAGLADGVAFVRDEVEANRCRSRLPPAGDTKLQLPVAILVGQSGQVRQIIPRAIGCPSVEQYTVGYLLSLTRRDSPILLAPGWYRLTVDYRW